MAALPLENAGSIARTTEKLNSDAAATSDRSIQVVRLQALEQYDEGFTYQQIADRLGISVGAAHKYVAMAVSRRDDLERQRVVADFDETLEALEKAESILLQKGLQGDIEAQQLMKQTIMSRCKLMKQRAEHLFPPLVNSPRKRQRSGRRLAAR